MHHQKCLAKASSSNSCFKLVMSFNVICRWSSEVGMEGIGGQASPWRGCRVPSRQVPRCRIVDVACRCPLTAQTSLYYLTRIVPPPAAARRRPLAQPAAPRPGRRSPPVYFPFISNLRHKTRLTKAANIFSLGISTYAPSLLTQHVCARL